MKPKRVLLLYISEHSGHHCASRAIEKALKGLDPSVETMNINSFNHTNPILEKVINRAYMSVIKHKPEIWDYLYDNPKVLKNTQKLRETFHRFNTGKFKNLLDDFAPDVIVCTQAFPCGMIADYKRSFAVDIPLVGVLTDYAPHSYWIYNNVDFYIVPSEETGKKLIDNGVEPSKIKPFGIPIDPKFMNDDVDTARVMESLSLKPGADCVLVMGGTQGLGPIKETVRLIDNSDVGARCIIVSGTNKRLCRWFRRRAFRRKPVCLSYAENIDELMGISKLIITKPGGITTAEALAKGLPMLIVNPLPGQEAMNTKYLISQGVAVKAENPEDSVVMLEELLYNTDKLHAMSARARGISRPGSSVDIARLVLELAGR
jgi:processive 1,2-diacylglycerol beta-glucosyltransferase